MAVGERQHESIGVIAAHFVRPQASLEIIIRVKAWNLLMQYSAR